MRGYLWTDLHRDVAEEFEALTCPVSFQALKMSFRENVYRLRLEREEAAILEQLGPQLREYRHRRADIRHGKVKTSGACSRCERPAAENRRQCEYHLTIARNAMRRRAMREKLPDTRPGLTLHFTIVTKDPEDHSDAPRVIEVDGYVTTGIYEDGRLGEVFVRVSKEAAALGPMMDQWATAVSVALQHGVPVRVILGKHVATIFEPSGAVTGVKGIKRCSSPLDLICRWLVDKYGEKDAVAVEETVQP